MNTINPNQVAELLSYDPSNGSFKWKARDLSRFKSENHGKIWNSRFAGKAAGDETPSGYRRIMIEGVYYFAHRLAWAIVYSEDPVFHIDHVNGDRSDNRIENLRKASSIQNNENSLPKVNAMHSKYKGVGWHQRDRVWRARIRVDGRRITVYAKSEIEAAKAYDNLALKHFGVYAKTNQMMGLINE